MTDTTTYVRRDEHGALRIGGTRVLLDSVVAAFQQGHSPETIRQQYPALRLEEVYGAVTHYLAHRPEVDEYLRRQAALWSHWKAKAADRPSPVAERLRNERHVEA